MEASKPIGFWLKHLHNLLEEQLDATLADLGIGRRHWQVLNTLGRGQATRAELEEALAPFWTAGDPGLEEVLGDLAAHGWVTGDGGALTEAGRAAHAAAAARIAATRETVLRGLTPEDYAHAVRTLSVMAGNVEAALAARRG
ncbi:MarR family transcriptional regulator [Thermoactinospora rubra]|uniref:MarR family transcriptional regulator n=1 Tax=Thermoactinospora rubra TaxID=1088767 RepID=UPI00117FF03F|nr:MarR family transcriptional regulator [Thermoactinospora rubra]